jgi:hypothetical protein
VRFSKRKNTTEYVAQVPQWETPPPGGTANQRRSMAANSEIELMRAIERRGRDLGMSTDRIIDTKDAAWAEIRRHGMGYEQLPVGDPEMDYDFYGI